MPSILTRLGLTLVNVRKAGLPCKAWLAPTLETSCLAIAEITGEVRSCSIVGLVGSFEAYTSVVTGICCTFIHVLFTVLSCVTWPTGTAVVLDSFNTRGIVQTGLRGTLQDIQLTVVPFKACVTAVTLVAVNEVMACPVVLAWLALTLVDVHLTLDSSVTGCTGAGVEPNVIYARGPILARV